jgi:hypothetical protein
MSPTPMGDLYKVFNKTQLSTKIREYLHAYKDETNYINYPLKPSGNYASSYNTQLILRFELMGSVRF